MDSIVTQELPLQPPQREPTDAEIEAARGQIAHLEAEARALGLTPAAAQIHHAMGRIFIEQLGDAKSAATCYQNACLVDPQYRPALEAARRLFASMGRYEQALALHQREESLLENGDHRAESLRAQALLLRSLGRVEDAKRLIDDALQLAPDHPALLKSRVEAAERDGDRALTASLLVRSAGATRDPVYRAKLLRRAVLLLDALRAEIGSPQAPTEDARPAELAALHEEAARKLWQADSNDPVGFSAMLLRARSSNDWEGVLRLCRQRAERTASAADRALVAAVAAYRLGRTSEGLAEATAALEENRRDGALLALRNELAEQQKSADLAEILRQGAEGSIEPTERAHLKFRAALAVGDPLEKEQLLSEALADNPGDAAAIAVHARLVTQRDPGSAADRFAALGEALESHAAEEAAGHYLEAAVWHERAGSRAEAAGLARRALKLMPRQGAALRLLTRTLPALGAGSELADLLEQVSTQLPRAVGGELLARASALVSEADPERGINLARRAAEMARGLVSPRWLETWSMLSFKAGDFGQLSQALEARADSTSGSDAADLLLEASELARAAGNDARSTTLLRKARGVDPASAAARNALLALPGLAPRERIGLLHEEAGQTGPGRAAALEAERAALLEEEGRVDEAVQACAQALTLGGTDLAVLRRLVRLQLRRGDATAALAVLVQIAEAVPEGHARAEAYGRAAELAEWRVGDPPRAVELYRAATRQHPNAGFAWAQLARLLAWTEQPAEAAAAYEHLATAAQSLSERNEARRWAAALYVHRANQPEKAAALLRALLVDAPGDLEATAELLDIVALEKGEQARKERIGLRGRLASRCQDPRVAALMRIESAEDRLAAGERDQGIAEYRRALALNPQDRVALDLVEGALRGSGQRSLLLEHLGFRSAFADRDVRAALAVEQAMIFTEQGRMDDAAAAYRQALASDPHSLLALKGAQHLAGINGHGGEASQLVATEAPVAGNVETAVESPPLAPDHQGVEGLTSALAADPANAETAARLRGLLPEPKDRALAGVYERIGHAQPDPRLGSLAWVQAGSVELRELGDAPAAFFAAGRALSRDPESLAALELRADAGEAGGRAREAAEALHKLLELGGGDARAPGWKLRLGRLHAENGESEKAVSLLGPALESLEPKVLLKLASGARSLPAFHAIRVYRRLLEAFQAPGDPEPTHAQLAEWSEALGRRLLAEDQQDAALEAFRRALTHEPGNVAALRRIADLGPPSDSIQAQLALFEVSPSPEPLRALAKLFDAQDRPDASFCAAAVLVGAGVASTEERAVHEVTAGRPPPADLPRIADDAAVHAPGDEGLARELLAAAMPELAKALPTEMGGRGALVKGDNPVRRVVGAIARALGMPEPQLYLARAEPGIVAPVAAEAPGVLVGAEVPKRWSLRQQRFLHARALAHIRRGTHAVAGFPAPRLAALVAELVRLVAPPEADLSALAAPDLALAECLAQHLGPDARARLSPLAARLAAEAPPDWDALALGIRESAERVALAVCGDPASAISIVCGETEGGLHTPEVARLARFAVGDVYLALRAR
jgi:tetratricopeptide (TPR) repeat protein